MKRFFTPSLSFIFFGCLLFVSGIFISCQKKWPGPSYNEGVKPTANNPWLPDQKIDLFTLGRVLFYDKNLSLDKSVSCGSCHQQAYGFSDNKALSTGCSGMQTKRNTHALMNTNSSHFWDGRTNNYLQAISIPLQTPSELNMTDLDLLCQRLSNIPYYPSFFVQASPYYTTTITPANIQLALSTFISSINADNCKYYQAYPPNGGTPTATLNQQELNGMAIFNGKGKCALCHNPANNFSGSTDQFEDIGLDATYTYLGRGGYTNLSSDNGRFQIPSLLNVSLTAPYMHDGRFKTLNEVVDFFSGSINSSPNLSSALTLNPVLNANGPGYTTGGPAAPIGLTANEKSDLIAFLLTLTDMSQVTNVNYSDPFKH